MKRGDMCQAVGRSLLIVGLMIQSSPVAWAQLATVDPALHAAVEALVTVDPEIAGDPELAQLCRSVAEATVTDIRERLSVAQEVALMQREGVDVRTVIPDAVRETAREQFTKVQGEMQKELETLRSVDPEKAKEIELMMREGERTMLAFESGERYIPSPEMVVHAEGMFKDWESDMLAQGAPPEFLEAARGEMARWSTGEMAMAFGGPGHDFAGPQGMPPSVEQMQAMGMSAEQIQAATVQHQYIEMGSSGQMPTLEQMQSMGMSAEQIQMAQQYETSSNFGVNPSTGGWEPNMGGSTSAYMPEGWAMDQSGSTHFVGTEGSNFGVNPATGGWEPNMGGGTTYTGVEGTTYTAETWTPSGGETYNTSTELKQDLQAETVEHTRQVTHTLEADGHAEEHWDGNGDNVPDHTHPIGTGAHH
ncbi:MAG: hypothetical protein Q8R91_04880 [Candidatus Omnitrophota bacterium]|nr:hypothetical protein [Candidatus Omnitrophota bacterium]